MATLIVGISDFKVAKAPDLLVTYALGSCVGVCLYDPALALGGLAHVMLPSRRISPHDTNLMKFADTAIPAMVQEIAAMGGSPGRLQAKLAGGAQMFISKGLSDDPFWQIGKRNVEAATESLQQLGIAIVAQDVLETHGRTVRFDPATGQMEIRAIGKDPMAF